MARHQESSLGERPKAQSKRLESIETTSFESEAQGQTHAAVPSEVDQHLQNLGQEAPQVQDVLEDSTSSEAQDENRVVQPPTAKNPSVAIRQRLAPKGRSKHVVHPGDRKRSINSSIEDGSEGPLTDDRGQFSEQEVRQRPTRPRRLKNADKGSLLSVILSDIASIPSATYWLWKWLILLYILWVASRFLKAWVHISVIEAFRPICSTRIGRQACPSFLQFVPQPPVTLANITAAQKETYTEVERIISDTARHRNLPAEILNREYALRDLAIRVRHSELENKWGISNELEQLTDLTASTSTTLFEFVAGVASLSDAVIAVSQWADRNLEKIQQLENKRPSALQIISSALLPLSTSNGLSLRSEDELKEVFIRITSELEEGARNLMKYIGTLNYQFEMIKLKLNKTGTYLQKEEHGEKWREKDVLPRLWMKLISPDDHVNYKDHRLLLSDLTDFYKIAMDVTQSTEGGLKNLSAHLRQMRDNLATPGLVLRDRPLEVSMKMLRGSIERIENSRKEIDGF